GALESVRAPVVPVITPAEVVLVRVGIDRWFLPEFGLLTPGQLEAKRFGDLPGNLLLHDHQFRDLLAELFTPELRLCRGVDQLGLDIEKLALLQHASGQDRARIEREAHRRW